MRLTRLDFQGTVDEYTAVRELFVTETDRPPVQDDPAVGSDEHDDIVQVLRRIPVPENHRRLFKVLAAAGESGLTRAELCSALEMNEGELNGILGALGRRINGTKGLRFNKGQGLALALFLDSWKDHDWHYRLRPQAKQALLNEGLLELDG